jgi:hypothetical protein
MTDDKIQPNPSDRPERAKPEQPDQEARQSEAVTPAQAPAPGRRPLFRN